MKQAWTIFKQDLANIKRVPLVGILIIGLAVLPALYAWFNLSASWDPYSNTDGINVAVVNEDRGAEVAEETLNIGNELEETLRDDDNFGWVFVSREEAEQGVKKGDYYASVYLDESLSEDLARVVDGEPESAHIHYQVNEKINAIAPQMTSAGASAIVNNLNDQLVAETSSALFREFDRVGLKLENEIPTFRQLKNIVYDLEKQLPHIREAADRIIILDDNWETAEGYVDNFLAVREYEEDIQAGAEKILELESHLPHMRELGEGVQALEKAIPEIEAAVHTLNGIHDDAEEVSGLIEKSGVHVSDVSRTLDDLRGQLQDIDERMAGAEDYTAELSTLLADQEERAEGLIELLAVHAQQGEEAAAELGTIWEELASAGEPEDMLDELSQLAERLAGGADFFDQAASFITALIDFTGTDSLDPLLIMTEEMASDLRSLQASVHDVEKIVASGEERQEDFVSLQETAEQAEDQAAAFQQHLETEANSQIETAFDYLDQGLEDAEGLVSGNSDVFEEADRLLAESHALAVAGEERVSDQIGRLPELHHSSSHILDTLNESLPVMKESVTAAGQFMEDDFPAIEERIETVAQSVRHDLPEMKEKYAAMAETLEDVMPVMEEAVSELAAWSREDFPEIEQGTVNTADTIRQLEEDDQLNELVSVLRNDLEEESAFFASPVQLVEEELFPIPNYGSANAPFYTALSLWVGALLLTNLLNTNLHPKDRDPAFTLRGIYTGRLILFLIVGILQGLIVSIGNLLLIGVYAAHPVMFVMFSVLIGLVFMTIVYTLASILGNIGKAVAIVFLVLQLSGGGGTFPIEVAPEFFQQIHPYLPFTYAINLLREAVGGIIPALVWKNTLMLAAFWGVTLAAGLLLKPLLAARIEKTYRLSKSSRLIE